MRNKYIYLILPIVIIIICNLLWLPNQLMITDEVSYYFQAKNWLGGNSNNTIIDAVSGTTHTLIEGHYPPGTSFVLSILDWIYKPLLYSSGILYLLGSIFIMYKCLKKLDLPIIALSILYLYIPLIFITRTTMSEMPSLLLVASGVYLYYLNSTRSYLWLAFITGLSISFRETNILLLAPLSFSISRNYILSILTFIAGASFRTIGYYILTGDPFLLKEGYPFGFEFLPDTLIIYSVVLLILLPFSPLWFTKVPRESLRPFALSLISFLILHLVYGYVAHVYSGFTNGLLLNGRFWIPALPIFVIALAYFLKDKKWINRSWIAVSVIILIAIVNLGVHYKSFEKQSNFKEFSNTIEILSKDKLTFIDMNSRTPIFRYIYPYATNRNWSDINLVNDTLHTNLAFRKYGIFQVATISSGATIAQSSRNAYFNSILNKLKEKYIVTHTTELCPSNTSCLNVYQISKR